MAKRANERRPEERPRRRTEPGHGSRKARQAAAQQRRRRTRSAGIAAAVAVLAVVTVLAIFSLTRSVATPQAAEGAGATGDAIQHVPVSTLDAVGSGTGVTPPTALPSGTAPLTEGGRPEVLYIGAEYCPFCAAQRWPLIVALSRFGSFQGLGATASSPSDSFPNTQTFSFHGATFTSDLLSFSGVETATNTGAPLDQPTAAEQALFQQYDAAPYTTAPGSIPFLLIGNRYVSIGSEIDPGTLQGMTRDQIVAALSDPNSSVARTIGGAANTITAAICQSTGGKPANVCTGPAVTQAATTLPSAG